jgi:hypothetical protein
MLSLKKALSALGFISLLLCSVESKKEFPKQRAGKRPIPKGRTQKVGALADRQQLRAKTVEKLETAKRLNRREKKEVASAELNTYKQKRREGVDEVTNTEEAVMLRNYRLRNKKKTRSFAQKGGILVTNSFPWCISRRVLAWFSNLDLCGPG